MIKLSNLIVFISTSPDGLYKVNLAFQLPVLVSTRHRLVFILHLKGEVLDEWLIAI